MPCITSHDWQGVDLSRKVRDGRDDSTRHEPGGVASAMLAGSLAWLVGNLDAVIPPPHAKEAPRLAMRS